jgi:protein-arginine kinase
MSSRKEIRQTLQDLLLYHASSAFLALSDDTSLTEGEYEAKRAELTKQFQRVERLFGVTPGITGI